MRIGLVCRPFSFHGGVETATSGLMKEMVRRGYQVELLTTAGQGAVPGVSIRRLPVLAGPRLARLLSFAFAARRAGRAGTYDVLQSHERGLAQDVYRAGEGTHRGYLEATGRRGARGSPYHLTVMWLEQRIFSLRSARHVVAISEAGLREMARLYGTPRHGATLVRNGVDLDRFHPDNRARFGAEARAAFGLPSDAWVVLFVGSGFERKGLGPLVQAMGRIGDVRARLVVAGKGRFEPYRRDAERLGLSDRVVWLGARPDVEPLYAAADVVALPARYEPFGNVHLEALASGVPVLSSAQAGGSELIRAGENGWVAGEVTPALIADGLDRLRESDPARLSESARRSAEPFTYAAQVDALAAIYGRLARP